ncbi:IclR family transcriptional regulator domain-containing protein [Streptomyces sp. NBC_00483]|uniref:IclR family transcriptional regulator domain-containing protein n=1 Tax=Streptomyces sp. NBC_00483 TaxID=2975756 RepID=UPI002E18F38B
MHTADDLRRSLAEVRRGEYAVARRADTTGPRTTAAAPVRSRDGVVAALSVVAPTPKFDSAAYVPAVRATARAISRQLQSTGAAR